MLLPARLLRLLRPLLRVLLRLLLWLRGLWLWRLRERLLRERLLWLWLRLWLRGLRERLLRVQLLRLVGVLRPGLLPAYACLRDQVKPSARSAEVAQAKPPPATGGETPCLQDIPGSQDSVLPPCYL